MEQNIRGEKWQVMVVCVCNCNLVWTRSVCAASVTTFSSCDTVSTEVVYVENGVQNEVSQMVKGWGVCNCNFTWTIKHLCVFTACNASLSQRDECGPNLMYFARYNARSQDIAQTQQLLWMHGLFKMHDLVKKRTGCGSGARAVNLLDLRSKPLHWWGGHRGQCTP